MHRRFPGTPVSAPLFLHHCRAPPCEQCDASSDLEFAVVTVSQNGRFVVGVSRGAAPTISTIYRSYRRYIDHIDGIHIRCRSAWWSLHMP